MLFVEISITVCELKNSNHRLWFINQILKNSLVVKFRSYKISINLFTFQKRKTCAATTVVSKAKNSLSAKQREKETTRKREQMFPQQSSGGVINTKCNAQTVNFKQWYSITSLYTVRIKALKLFAVICFDKRKRTLITASWRSLELS